MSFHGIKGNSSTRRSLRERLRDGIANVASDINPLQHVVQKSRSVDNGSTTTSTSSSLNTGEENKPTRTHSVGGLLGKGSTSSINASTTSQSGKSNRLSTESNADDKEKWESYVVKNNDTVTSVAAKFNLTPNELKMFNHKIIGGGRMIFPGQVLRIPSSSQSDDGCFVSDEENESNNQQKHHRHALQQKKFLKLNVRHITDGKGVISGTLLVTPNAVMFDPNVSDPLVIDQGAESFGVIIPLDLIVHTGIYSDIVYMRVRGKRENIHSPNDQELCQFYDEKFDDKFLIKQNYRNKPQQESIKDFNPPLISTTSEDGKEEIHESSRRAEPDELVLNEEETPNQWYLCLTLGVPIDPLRLQGIRPSMVVSYGHKGTCVQPEYWFALNDANLHDDVHSLYQFWMLWWPHLYHDCVNVQTISEQGYKLIEWDTNVVEMIPQAVISGPLNAANKEESSTILSTAIDTTTAVANEVNEIGKESWEMIKAPYTRLYSFIRSQTVVSGSTGSQSDLQSDAALSTMLVEDMNCDETTFDTIDEKLQMVIDLSEEYRRAYELDDVLPEMNSTSEILNEKQLKFLNKHLTPRAQGYPWELIFSTSRDGFTLNSMYRKTAHLDSESPLLIVILDTNKRVFGALLSSGLHVSDHFYGTGQSFLYTFNEKNDDEEQEGKIFKWTGENAYFAKGNFESLYIGAGQGRFGLTLDGDLNNGRTDACTTYGNPPLVEDNDFIIKSLECWTFGY